MSEINRDFEEIREYEIDEVEEEIEIDDELYFSSDYGMKE